MTQYQQDVLRSIVGGSIGAIGGNITIWILSLFDVLTYNSSSIIGAFLFFIGFQVFMFPRKKDYLTEWDSRGRIIFTEKKSDHPGIQRSSLLDLPVPKEFINKRDTGKPVDEYKTKVKELQQGLD